LHYERWPTCDDSLLPARVRLAAARHTRSAQLLVHMLLPSNSVTFNALMSTPSKQRTLMARM
jgi:hypothetical protein